MPSRMASCPRQSDTNDRIRVPRRPRHHARQIAGVVLEIRILYHHQVVLRSRFQRKSDSNPCGHALPRFSGNVTIS